MKAEDVRENEAITVDPFGVLGVEGHELVEEDVGHRGHAHGGAGMARVGLEGRIHLEKHKSQSIEAAGQMLSRADADALGVEHERKSSR